MKLIAADSWHFQKARLTSSLAPWLGLMNALIQSNGMEHIKTPNSV